MKVQTLIAEATAICHSEAELARVLGVSRGNVNDWKQGTRPCPDKYILEMAKLVGRDPIATAVEVYKERLGELLRAPVAGVAAMLCIFGAGALVTTGATRCATMYRA